jgi:hypothetical protein
MDSVTFCLSTAPDLEPVGLNPPFLRIFASLNLDLPLGRLDLNQHSIQSVGEQVPLAITIQDENIAIELGFIVVGQPPF